MNINIIHLYALIICFILSIFDIKTRRIPNIILMPSFGFLILSSIFLTISNRAIGDLFIEPNYQGLAMRFLSSLLYFLILLALKLKFKIKLGIGDIKLISFIAYAFGPYGILFILLFSSLAGLIYWIIIYKIILRSNDLSIPFAPFLSLAMIIYASPILKRIA